MGSESGSSKSEGPKVEGSKGEGFTSWGFQLREPTLSDGSKHEGS